MACCIASMLTACRGQGEVQAVKSPPTLSPLSGRSMSPPAGPSGHDITLPITQKSSEHGLTMEAAVQRAVSWYPSMAEAEGKIYQYDERIKSAEGGYLPKVNAGLGGGYKNYNDRGWHPQASVSATQMLYDFGKVSSAVETERAGRNISAAQYLLRMESLGRDVAHAVIEVQRYKSLLDLAEAQIAGVRKIAELVKQRTDEGATSASDLVQAQARVDQAEATKLQYQSEYNLWRTTLASLTGLDNASFAVADSVPPWLDGACTVSVPDWNKAPAILEAEARKQEAEAQLAASKAAGLPTVNLEATAGYDLSNSTATSNQGQYSIGVNVSAPLYNGGQTAANRRAATHAVKSADAAINAARLDLQRGLMESRGQIAAMERLIVPLQARVKAMEKTRDLYREQYVSLGTRTLLDLLNAEQELHQARFQIANAKYDTRRLQVGCLYNSGLLRTKFNLKTPVRQM